MAATYDVTTDRGKVRLLITDTDTTDPIFQDDEIDAFLSLESSNIYYAAAQALMVIAANEVLVLKVIKLLDLQTDGARVGAELRAQAKELRTRADEMDYNFDWAEMNLNQFTYREIMYNNYLRDVV